jgi:hypothetical protein
VVERDEKAVGLPAQGAATLRPGKFTVEAGHVTGLPSAPPDAALDDPLARRPPPDVHVHIDRVVVTRAPSPPAPPPPPPAPAPRPASTVDHDDYLARRERA